MQNAPPELPPIPPMKAAASTEPQPVPYAASARPAPPFGPLRLRQAVTAIAGGGLALTVVVFTGELALRPGIRPSDLMATIEARTDLGIMNQKMKLEPGQMLLTEADYRAKLAEAERAGQAKAELVFQKELAVVQADKERVVGAYTTLYQRANMIAQAALQLETLAQQFRQRLLEMSSGGRNMVIMFKDIFCGLGDPQACASAREDRGTMIAEADELSRGDVGNRVRELMSGIEDPAAFITRDDQRRNGTPAIDR